MNNIQMPALSSVEKRQILTDDIEGRYVLAPIKHRSKYCSNCPLQFCDFDKERGRCSILS